MKKIIVVENCKVCPHKEETISSMKSVYEIDIKCLMCHKSIAYRIDPRIETIPIPDWCPLEDYHDLVKRVRKIS